jgi:hypothetical protein
MRSFFRAVALALSFLVIVGCSDGPRLVPVKGIATRGGKPVASLSITFFPADNSKPSTARTDDSGHFEMVHDRQAKGVVPGPNKVVVAFRPRDAAEEMKIREGGQSKFHPEQDAIIAKYGKRETTPLTVDITKAESNLELKLD